MQALANRKDISQSLNQAMQSLEALLNKNDPNYVLNAIKYYKSHKSFDNEAIVRIEDMLSKI